MSVRILVGENSKCLSCVSHSKAPANHCLLSGKDTREYSPDDECVNYVKKIFVKYKLAPKKNKKVLDKQKV